MHCTTPILKYAYKNKESILFAALSITLSALFLLVWFQIGLSDSLSAEGYEEWNHHYVSMNQYGILANSLINGHFYLDLPVPEELLALDNPYDFSSRYAIGSEAVPIFWDFAFYEGKYYCYFGVVPAVLLFVPFQLITGHMLSSSLATAFLGPVVAFASVSLVRNIASCYFPKTSTLAVATCCILFFAGCNVIYGATLPRFYSVAILSAMAFTFWGISLCLSAKKASSASGRISTPRIALGCSFLAASIGCRPQFALSLFLVFVIFWNEIRHQRLLFSKKGLKPTIVTCFSVLAVLTLLLAYNVARFGSPLNMGSHYNLTGFDMQSYNQDLGCTLHLLYQYTLEPPNLSRSFPFFESNPFVDKYGWSPHEPMYGGYLWFCPFLLAPALAPIALKRIQKTQGALPLITICLFFATAILLIDTRNAGISQRYICDFGWYVSLASIAILMSIMQDAKRNAKVVIAAKILIVVSISFSLMLGGLTIYAPDRYDSIAQLNPSLWESISSIF